MEEHLRCSDQKIRYMAKPNTIIRSIEINRTLDKLLEDGHVDEYFVESIRDLIIMARNNG